MGGFSAAIGNIFELILQLVNIVVAFTDSIEAGFKMIGDWIYNGIAAIAATISFIVGFLEMLVTFAGANSFLPGIVASCFTFFVVCIAIKLLLDIFL